MRPPRWSTPRYRIRRNTNSFITTSSFDPHLPLAWTVLWVYPYLDESVKSVQIRTMPQEAAQTSALPGAESAPIAFRAFLRIAELWGLGVDEQLTLLGQPARSTFYKWRKEGAQHLPHDVVERLSYVLGIYKSLQILLPEPERADAWIRRPNEAPLFAGGSALERMLAGQVADLFVVRQYLDAQLGGWP